MAEIPLSICPFAPGETGDLLLPLYGFASDAETLEIGDLTRILKFNPEWMNSLFEGLDLYKYLDLFEPDYVIWEPVPTESVNLPGESEHVVGNSEDTNPFLHFAKSHLDSLDRGLELVTYLRLFKPGVFRRGEPWVVFVSEPISNPENRGGLGSPIKATIGITLHRLIPACISWAGSEPLGYGSRPKSPYRLDSSELAFFRAFVDRLGPALRKSRDVARFVLAEHQYEKSFGEDNLADQLVTLFVSLEALLLQEGEELSFRLAVRCANLLGADSDERKGIYMEIRNFYKIRSKVVHGDVLKSNHKAVLNQVNRLRELVRRALLCSVALAADTGVGAEFYQSLDEMALDEDKRTQIQMKASTLLHMR